MIIEDGCVITSHNMREGTFTKVTNMYIALSLKMSVGFRGV